MMITYSELRMFQQDRRRWWYLKWLLITALVLAVPAAAPADTINVIASELRADSPVPFRYGTASLLAGNIWDAQLSASYAGAESLELSIESVIRAIGIDGTAYVGFANIDPITWLQSTIAIDPGATIGITPSALRFGERAVVATPESSTWLLIIWALVILGIIVGFRWLRKPQVPKPPVVILTPWGPVTESARKQAALNMMQDNELRGRVFDVVLRECGGNKEKAGAEFLRRYPELSDVHGI